MFRVHKSECKKNVKHFKPKKTKLICFQRKKQEIINSRLSNPPNVGRLEINIVLCHLNSDRSESSFRVIVSKLENIDQDAKRKPLLIEQETE